MAAGAAPLDARGVGADRSGGATQQDLVRRERDVQAHLGGLPIDPRAMAAVSNVFRVANAVRLHMERRVLGDDGISWTAFVVLWVLWVWGEQESRHLAVECGVSKATLSGVVTTLETRGLVTRDRHPGDGRLVIVSLSPAGRRMIRRLYPRFNQHEAMVVSRLSTTEQDQLAHLLREVLRSVDPDGDPD
jgi:MarR family transcriptional regulator, organic hydroperoxide resistance regulator